MTLEERLRKTLKRQEADEFLSRKVKDENFEVVLIYFSWVEIHNGRNGEILFDGC